MLLDLKENQTLKHSSTQTKTYKVLRITECQSIEIFAEKQQVKWLAHCVRMENDALQKFSLFMTTTKKNYKSVWLRIESRLEMDQQ